MIERKLTNTMKSNFWCFDGTPDGLFQSRPVTIQHPEYEVGIFFYVATCWLVVRGSCKLKNQIQCCKRTNSGILCYYFAR